MLFNTTDDLSFEEIKQAVGMDDKELRVTMQSLACAKIKILNKVSRRMILPWKKVVDEYIFSRPKMKILFLSCSCYMLIS